MNLKHLTTKTIVLCGLGIDAERNSVKNISNAALTLCMRLHVFALRMSACMSLDRAGQCYT